MKKTHFEVHNELTEGAFKKNFFEDLYKFELTTNQKITEHSMMSFVEKRIGKRAYEESKPFFVPEFVEQVYYNYLFFKYGKKVFQFEENITKMLLETDLNNIDTEFLKIPFKSIYIGVPYGIFNKHIENEDVSLIGVYVYDLTTDEINSNFKKERLLILRATFSKSEDISEHNNHSVGHMDLILTPGNLFEQLRYNYERVGSTALEMSISDEIISFIANAILYLNSDKKIIELIEPEAQKVIENKKSSKKKKKLERKFKDQSKLPYYLVGRTITIDNKKVRTNNESSNNTKPSKKTPRLSQWIVRGHWRNQVFGENRKERKLIWIKPYIKGVANTPIIETDYKVK